MLIEYSHHKGSKTEYFIPWFMSSGNSLFALSHFTTEIWVTRVNLEAVDLTTLRACVRQTLNPKPLTGAKKLLFAMP
jgi:hypothetical protein